MRRLSSKDERVGLLEEIPLNLDIPIHRNTTQYL